MSTNSDTPAEPNDIRLQAAGWIARADRGLSPAEQDQLSDWLATRPEHAKEYGRLQKRWRQLNHLVEWRPVHGTTPNADLLAPAKPRPLRHWAVPFAAAAAIAMGLGLAVWRSPATADRVVRPVVLADSTRPRQILEDGSVIELNRGAIVTVEYSPTVRSVRLEQGEAHFTVEENPARPFIVTAEDIEVRALGAAFNVRLDGSAVEVLVTEGNVRLDPAGAAIEAARSVAIVPQLEARQHAILAIDANTPPRIAELTSEEIERRLAWQHRLLEYTATSGSTPASEP